MASDSDEAQIVTPEWEERGPVEVEAPPASPASWRPVLGALGLVCLAVVVVLAGRSISRDTASPESLPDPRHDEPPTSQLGQRTAGVRTTARLDAPVLGVEVGAVAVSTDFDGRIVVLDLDTGELTRTPIRTGRFVTTAGRLFVQTGCGGWREVDLATFALGDDLLGCGSYQPHPARGGEAFLFARPNGRTSSAVVILDERGRPLAAELEGVAVADIATSSAGRVLVEATEGLVWVDLTTGEESLYAEGQLIEASPSGVLWTECGDVDRCDVYFGNADDSRILRFVVEPFGGERLVRLNAAGTRAVFFKDDGMLRIITLETGHAREVANPGINWATSTWTPDGLWLLDPDGGRIVALNTLNGRSVDFAAVPGDVSPGWVALLER
jgi:hypothetical protein